mmetsp:Transcript_2951/g.11270  ORF Transcript_2951/g.11270 Transcript_2951/m.11270 type:complete len:654 (-) Transcript_2951:2936-4897(-)
MSYTQLSRTLILHRLNTHLSLCHIPKLTSFSDITPSLFIILFESILHTKIPYVKRENVKISDYMHNLQCLKTYLMEMGLNWLQEKMRDLDLWDLIDMGEDDDSMRALEWILEVFEGLKDWLETVEGKRGASSQRRSVLLDADGLGSRRRHSHNVTFSDERRRSNSPPSPASVSDTDLQIFTSRFERMTSQKRWSEAASLIRELESKTNQVKDKTRAILALDNELERQEMLDSLTREVDDLEDDSPRAIRHQPAHSSSMRRPSSSNVETSSELRYRHSPRKAQLYNSKLGASVPHTDRNARTKRGSSSALDSVYKSRRHTNLRDDDDVSSVHSFDDLKPSVMRTILNESSIKRPEGGTIGVGGSSFLRASKNLSSKLQEARVVSRFKELSEMDKSFGASEEELESKMQSMLKTHRELKRERQLLEDERRLFHTLNSDNSRKKTRSTKKKKRPKSAMSGSMNKSLTLMKSRRKSLRSISSRSSKKSFSEFKKLYDKCLDAFLNGETDVQPTLAVRNLLRDRKIEEIRLRREKEGVEQRLHMVEARHQREQERVIRNLMKKMQQVEKEKRKFEKIQRKALDSELAHKRNERQAVLESYYTKQISLLGELMHQTESDEMLKRKTRKWAKELFDRSTTLSKNTLGFLEKSSRIGLKQR